MHHIVDSSWRNGERHGGEVKAKLRSESKQAVHNYFPLTHLFVSLGTREGEEGILTLPGDGSLMKVFLGNDLAH